MLLSVDDHRHADGDALVAAARVDDHRHGAAVHPGVGAGGGVGAGADVDGRIGVALQQDAAHLGAVGVLQALPADSHVALDLGGEDGLHLRELHLVGKLQNVLHRQKAAVTALLDFLLLGDRDPGAVHPVLLHPGDIFVGVLDLHQSGVLPGGELYHNIQGSHIFNELAGAEVALQQLPHLGPVLVGDALQHGQLQLRVAAHNAQGGGYVDAPQAAGVGDGDAHDVFDNIAAAMDGAVLGHFSQQLAGLGGGVGDGNRFRAPKGHGQLGTQDSQMIFIQCLIQTDTPFLVACFSTSVGSHKTDPQKREDSFPIIACLVESRKGKRGAGSQANRPWRE